MISDLLEAMKGAIAELERWPCRRVQLVHHNDSDGLSSAAILRCALSRRGLDVDHLCLEKPYPAVLARIFAQQDGLIIFADFGGRIAPLISDLNRSRNLVLILDHHKAAAATDPRVHNLDPELYGLLGDRDITASTTCYLFAYALDQANADLARLAAIGAVGDRFFVDGRLAGPNRAVALTAVAQDRLAIEDVEDGSERYVALYPGRTILCSKLAEDLDTLGGAGYLKNGPQLGVALCLEGPSPQSARAVKRLQKMRDHAFAAEIARIRGGELESGPHIQWLHVGARFAPMGVKMIGVFLDTIRDSDLVDPARYLAGFQEIPDDIPGVGRLGMGHVKISMRVSTPLAGEIRAGRRPGLDTFLPEATARLGGFSDACHSLSAATTVHVGDEERLIAEMESILAS